MNWSHLDPEIEQTVKYLGSSEAIASLDLNSYWPKWDGPYWQMVLLWEMGLVHRIPERPVRKLVELLQTQFVQFFPLKKEELPAGKSVYLHVPCHCQLGTVYQLLGSWGVPVDVELPWIRPWFLKYQLPDGGLNCDESVYLTENPHSSMVATIAVLEAVLLQTKRDFTEEEVKFLDRGVACLVGRKLMLGSHEEERLDEEDWVKPCFPRFYFYDVWRGATFLSKWSERMGREIPSGVMAGVEEVTHRKFPDGVIRVERRAHEGIGTLRWNGAEWARGKEGTFPLLEKIEIAPGEISLSHF